MNESIDSWASWSERMEKDYKVMKEQIDNIAKEFQKLQNALSNSTKTHELEKDIDVLTKKIQEIEVKTVKNGFRKTKKTH
ncbi:hypothetical protein DI43_07985 [Geobacillus sp. CAMR12739]|nr:hypothetical protein DI43_07985 [Geobacillus sp. CAMR12739]